MDQFQVQSLKSGKKFSIICKILELRDKTHLVSRKRRDEHEATLKRGNITVPYRVPTHTNQSYLRMNKGRLAARTEEVMSVYICIISC